MKLSNRPLQLFRNGVSNNVLMAKLISNFRNDINIFSVLQSSHKSLYVDFFIIPMNIGSLTLLLPATNSELTLFVKSPKIRKVLYS